MNFMKPGVFYLQKMMNFVKPGVFYLQKMMNFMKMCTFYKKLPLFVKNSILHTYKKLKPQIWAFIKNSIFGTFRDPCCAALTTTTLIKATLYFYLPTESDSLSQGKSIKISLVVWKFHDRRATNYIQLYQNTRKTLFIVFCANMKTISCKHIRFPTPFYLPAESGN